MNFTSARFLAFGLAAQLAGTAWAHNPGGDVAIANAFQLTAALAAGAAAIVRLLTDPWLAKGPPPPERAVRMARFIMAAMVEWAGYTAAFTMSWSSLGTVLGVGLAVATLGRVAWLDKMMSPLRACLSGLAYPVAFAPAALVAFIWLNGVGNDALFAMASRLGPLEVLAWPTAVGGTLLGVLAALYRRRQQAAPLGRPR